MLDKPASELTEEDFAESDEQAKVLNAIHKAKVRGDRAAQLALYKKLIVPAESLLAAKENHGADWIRERGYDTRRADKKYGEGWLDR